MRKVALSLGCLSVVAVACVPPDSPAPARGYGSTPASAPTSEPSPAETAPHETAPHETARAAPPPHEPCMVDPSDGRLKKCHHVSATGTCHHYGIWCNGSDVRPTANGTSAPRGSQVPCLYDPSDGRTKECHHVTTDGACVHFGAWCGPASMGSEPCMYDGSEKRYRTCHHVTTDGKCAHYGSACRP